MRNKSLRNKGKYEVFLYNISMKDTMIKEEWRPVKVWKKGVLYDYTGKYEVSNLGRVKSIKFQKAKLLKPGKAKNGYLLVRLYASENSWTFYLHRLVWEAFNGKILEGIQVNHKNEIKTDNRLENLNLMTPKENCNWGTAQDRKRKSMKEKHRYLTEEHKQKLLEGRKKSNTYRNHTDYRVKIVQQYDVEGNLLTEYNSISEASKKTGCSKSVIWNSCKNNFGYHKNFVWEFK